MMQFDWTTFFLEILNFLVLLCLLQRFLYRPVLASLDARQQRINDEMARTEQLRGEAEVLREQYSLQLKDWQQFQETSRRQLDEELNQIRNIALEKLKQTLADEEAKLRIRNQALIASREAVLLREAVDVAYAQAAAMLQRLATPQLTQRLVDLLLEDLPQLPHSQLAALQKAADMMTEASKVEVVTAHPLDSSEREKLTISLSAAVGKSLRLTFREDPGLIAGLRVAVDDCQLHANLFDELGFFRHQAQYD